MERYLVAATHRPNDNKGMISQIEQYVIDSVRASRIELGISQAVLADSINISRGFMGDVGNLGFNAKYNFNHINEIAKVLNCSPKDFLPQEPID